MRTTVHEPNIVENSDREATENTAEDTLDENDMPELPEYLRYPAPLLIVLSGPSGVGKDACVMHMKERGLPFYFVVTATTRPQRPGEVHGRDYFFIGKEEYDDLLARDEFLEHAQVYGNFYGVPKQQVREAWARGQDVLLRIDVQGAATIRKIASEGIFIFLAASSMEQLMHRLVMRKTETGADLERRMRTARKEMKRFPEFDYVVINEEDCLDEAVDKIMAIIQAEKCSVQPRHLQL